MAGLVGTYVLCKMAWEPVEAVKHRNLGCPLYAECLHAATQELNTLDKPGLGRRRKRQGGRRSWKLGTTEHTWVCSPACMYREEVSDYNEG